MTFKVQNSERLSLKLMSSTDADLLFNLDQDPEVMRYINGGKMTSMDEIENIFIPRMKKYTNPEKGWGLWKACKLDNHEFIGWVLVRPVDFFNEDTQWDNLELGWRFFQKHWGKGYATEASNAVKEALLELGQATKLTALAMEDNHASINIMKKLGMTFLKKDIHRDPLGDMDVVYYQLDVS